MSLRDATRLDDRGLQMLIEVILRYFGDTEVFRTSTEEPNRRGISYTYVKDMSQYMALWKQPQKVIFDLPNTLTDVVSGVCLDMPLDVQKSQWGRELILFSVDRSLQHYLDCHLLQRAPGVDAGRHDNPYLLPPGE